MVIDSMLFILLLISLVSATIFLGNNSNINCEHSRNRQAIYSLQVPNKIHIVQLQYYNSANSVQCIRIPISNCRRRNLTVVKVGVPISKKIIVEFRF